MSMQVKSDNHAFIVSHSSYSTLTVFIVHFFIMSLFYFPCFVSFVMLFSTSGVVFEHCDTFFCKCVLFF